MDDVLAVVMVPAAAVGVTVLPCRVRAGGNATGGCTQLGWCWDWGWGWVGLRWVRVGIRNGARMDRGRIGAGMGLGLRWGQNLGFSRIGGGGMGLELGLRWGRG